MLKTSLMFAAAGLVLAMLAPQFLPSLLASSAPPPRVAAPVPVAAPAAPITVAAAPSDGFREKTLPADARGQYEVDALIEGQSAHMMVDTGATMVAISADLADRLGVRPDPAKPKWRVHTANGDTLASQVTLKNVDLGSIYMNDVEALVMDRAAGDVNLLGESFLKRLASVEQRNGMLVLRQ